MQNKIQTYRGLKYFIYWHALDEGRSGMAFFCGYVRLPYNHPWRRFCTKKKVFDSGMVSWKMRKMLAEQKKEVFTEKKPKENRKRYFFDGYDSMRVDVHGGLTYSYRIENNKEILPRGNWIGWDYGHAGGEVYLENLKEENPVLYAIHSSHESHNKRWTREEVEEHCKDVIDQVLRIKK